MKGTFQFVQCFLDKMHKFIIDFTSVISDEIKVVLSSGLLLSCESFQEQSFASHSKYKNFLRTMRGYLLFCHDLSMFIINPESSQN